MDTLMATYGSDSDENSENSPPHINNSSKSNTTVVLQISNPKKKHGSLPPPPLHLLKPPNFIDLSCSSTQGVRVRSFPHVEGNYALHVYIPVHIPPIIIKQIASYLEKVSTSVPGLHVIEVDVAVNELVQKYQNLEQIISEREFHISLGRPVPIKVHQIDSIVAMLRQKFQPQKGYQIEFNKWDVFTNDDLTRTFLSLEVTGEGLSEICRQIQIVDDIYKLHGLPEFYKDRRPHISLIWALGDISIVLKQAVTELDRICTRPSASQRHIFTSKFSSIECKIGKKLYNIFKFRN